MISRWAVTSTGSWSRAQTAEGNAAQVGVLDMPPPHGREATDAFISTRLWTATVNGGQARVPLR